MPIEDYLEVTHMALRSGRQAVVQPTSARIKLDSGETVTITETGPTFPVGDGGRSDGAVARSTSEWVDLAIGLYDKIMGDGGGGGGGGGGGDEVTVTVKGAKGKKVTIIIEK